MTLTLIPASGILAHSYWRLTHYYFKPSFLHAERLDLKKPALLVGNHTIFGVLDVPFLVDYIYRTQGVLVRGLADRLHFKYKYWRQAVESHGGVLASPENCRQLMQAGESIVVFPGGAREVMRRRGEQHQLIWKNRIGFARLAIEQGYDIIPFASYGPDHSYDVVYDVNDLKQSKLFDRILNVKPIQSITRQGEIVPSIATGLAKTLLPKPQRFYFSFGERISTTGLDLDDEAAWHIRHLVANSIELQLVELAKYSAQDQQIHWSAIRRMLCRI